MVDLSTDWMGLKLSCPLVAGASPLSAELDSVRALADAGAGAVVLQSLFEEQLLAEQMAMLAHVDDIGDTHAEALSFFPEPVTYHLGPDAYLRHITALKEAVPIPVVASLNGITPGGWLRYGKRMVDAGADALELNVYHLATDPEESPAQVEQRYVDILQTVKEGVRVPVAVKISPFFSSPVHFARRLDVAGADAVVVFNRFYEPDIDIENLEAAPVLHLSDSSELLLRLRWLAAIWGHVDCALVATGGVHTATDAIKALMAGATVVQMASALLHHGPAHLGAVRAALEEWLTDHEYDSVAELTGSMSLQRMPDPATFQRANYMRILKSWHR